MNFSDLQAAMEFGITRAVTVSHDIQSLVDELRPHKHPLRSSDTDSQLISWIDTSVIMTPQFWIYMTDLAGSLNVLFFTGNTGLMSPMCWLIDHTISFPGMRQSVLWGGMPFMLPSRNLSPSFLLLRSAARLMAGVVTSFVIPSLIRVSGLFHSSLPSLPFSSPCLSPSIPLSIPLYPPLSCSVLHPSPLSIPLSLPSPCPLPAPLPSYCSSPPYLLIHGISACRSVYRKLKPFTDTQSPAVAALIYHCYSMKVIVLPTASV